MGKVVVQNQDERNQQSAVVNTWQELGDCFFFSAFFGFENGYQSQEGGNQSRAGGPRLLSGNDSIYLTPKKA